MILRLNAELSSLGNLALEKNKRRSIITRDESLGDAEKRAALSENQAEKDVIDASIKAKATERDLLEYSPQRGDNRTR